ncbi:hypothetical protein KY310_04405 [Candidatus Woesearchaeota archaeon]|nr:hypothetical protein [Candidatus Woesearchaeota archaeon]
MGKLVDNYQKHSENGSETTEFEHKYIITIPPLTENMPPRVLAEAPLKVTYATCKADGTSRATITADMQFPSAVGLFAAIERAVHPDQEILLTECPFLDEKLVGLGMKLIEEGYKDQPSVFSAAQDLFQELAGKDFCIRGTYHGKPYKIWCLFSDAGSETTPRLSLVRKTDDHGRHHTDSYYLETIRTAKPAEIKKYLTKFEEAIAAWEDAIKTKHFLKHGTGVLE